MGSSTVEPSDVTMDSGDTRGSQLSYSEPEAPSEAVFTLLTCRNCQIKYVRRSKPLVESLNH